LVSIFSRSSNKERSTLALNPPAALVLGWLVFAIVSSAVLFVVAQRSLSLSASQRLLLHLYGLGHALALGCAIAAGVWIWKHWKGSRRYLGWAIAAIASVGVGLLTLAEDLTGPAARMSGGSESPLPLLAMIVLVSLGVPVVAFVATWLARGFWRLLPLCGALFAMVLPNGLKLIRNQREKTFEIYDLTKDPKELDNLYDKMGAQGALEMQELVQFFNTYQIRKDGYTIPYRR